MKKLRFKIPAVMTMALALLAGTFSFAPSAVEAASTCPFSGTLGGLTVYNDGGSQGTKKIENSSGAITTIAVGGHGFTCPYLGYIAGSTNWVIKCSNGNTYTVKGSSLGSRWIRLSYAGTYPCNAVGATSGSVRISAYHR